MSNENAHTPDSHPEMPGAPVTPEGAVASATGEQRQLVLVKHGQRYIFRYAPGDEAGMLENLIELARDPKSDLTWFDAAVLSHQMGKGMGKKLERMVAR